LTIYHIFIDMSNLKLKDVVKIIIRECMSEDAKHIPICELKTMSLDSFLDLSNPKKEELSEAEGDMLGSTTRPMSSDEMQSYLNRVVDKTKTPGEKYKMPFIHPSNVEIKDELDRKFDLEKLKLAVKTRPAKILKQNEKITHSGGDSTIYFNIGLPALKGLAVDEKSDQFVIVDTCPGAGACKVYCYARKGGYVQWKSSSMSQTRMLNFLLNDPEGFKTKLISELRAEEVKYKKKNTNVVVRWHDAGDFFSPDYLSLAYSVARTLPDVEFYAYTKMASVAMGEKPKNFKINFSSGATPEQEKQIDFKNTKHSTVVPKDIFAELITKNEDGKVIKDERGRIQFSPENLDILRKRLGNKYNVSTDSIITYDEMQKISSSDEPKYNVIVRPGDGDDSANRSDVLGTYLLIH